jgi:hypothetical protein
MLTISFSGPNGLLPTETKEVETIGELTEWLKDRLDWYRNNHVEVTITGIPKINPPGGYKKRAFAVPNPQPLKG